MDDLLRILALLALIAGNAFFVIGEYSIVTARRSALRQRGGKGAQAALRLMEDPVRVISTVQVGITGIGVLSAQRIEQLRRQRKIRYEDLRRLRCALDKAGPFIVTADYRPRQDSSESLRLRQQLAERPAQQMALW